MTKMRARALLGCLLLLSSSTALLARTSSPRVYASEETRDIVGGRKVLILVPESINSTYDDHSLQAGAFLLGGKLLQSLAEKSARKAMTEKAEREIAPLRVALEGFEFEKPMRALLIPPVESSRWIRGQDFEISRDRTPENIERELNDSNTRQMLVLNANYYADPKFRNMAVSVETTILVRRIPKGKYGHVRLEPEYIPCRQMFRAIIYLPDSERAEPEQNLARWSADGGRLARQALDIGMREAGALYAQNLDATEETAAVWSKRGKRKTVTEFHLLGWVIKRDANSIVFFSPADDALNYIEVLRP